MTLQTRAAGKAAVAASVYTNILGEVSGNEVRDAVNNLADSAIIGEAWEDIASATTCAIGGTSSNFVNVTGTTTITGFGTIAAGTYRKLKFAGVLLLTHNATSLIIQGVANITTAAGDIAEVVSEGSGNWRVLSYRKANGKALIGPASTDISDSTATGRSAITAANAAALATAGGVGTGDSPTLTALTLSGGKLSFPATQSASADPNTLDDYEEGTFTPVFTTDGTPPTGVTYGARSGQYTKIGNAIIFRAQFTLTNKGSGGTGNAIMTGNPFSPSVDGVLLALPGSIDFSAGQTGFVGLPSGASIYFYQFGDNTALSATAWSQFVNTSYVNMFGHLYA